MRLLVNLWACFCCDAVSLVLKCENLQMKDVLGEHYNLLM